MSAAIYINKTNNKLKFQKTRFIILFSKTFLGFRNQEVFNTQNFDRVKLIEIMKRQ